MLLAGAASVGSAGCFAVCSVLQQREAVQETSGGLTLLWRLLHRPLFLLATVVEIAGLGLQALALALGAVSVVQVLLVTGLLFAVPLSALLESRRPTPRELLGALLVVAGLAAFLVAARPAEGVPVVRLVHILPFAGALVGVALALAVAGLRVPRLRGALLAASAGTCYGLSSGLFKVVTDIAGDDGFAVLVTWPPYALVATGALGLVLTQTAFQSGSLGLPLAVLTLAEPCAAVAFGAVVLAERLASSPAARVAEVLAVLAAAAGVVALSTTPAGRLRAPVLEPVLERDREPALGPEGEPVLGPVVGPAAESARGSAAG